MANYLQGVGQLPAMSAEVLETGKIPETDILGLGNIREQTNETEKLGEEKLGLKN